MRRAEGSEWTAKRSWRRCDSTWSTRCCTATGKGSMRTRRCSSGGSWTPSAMEGLLAFIAERFAVEVPFEEVRPESFRSLRALSALLARLPAQTTASGSRRESAGAGAGAGGCGRPPGARRGRGPRHAARPVHRRRRPPAGLRRGPGDAVELLGSAPAIASGRAGVRGARSRRLRAVRGPRGAVCPRGSRSTGTIAVLDQTVREPAVLIGQSAGALVAAQIALKRPAAALIAIAFGTLRRSGGVARAPARAGARARGVPRARAPPRSRPPRPPSSPRWARTLRSAPWTEFYGASLAEAIPRAFARPSVPALVIAGDSDRLVPREAAEAAAQALETRVEWIARCGHTPQVERPHELLLVIDRFVRSLGGDR